MIIQRILLCTEKEKLQRQWCLLRWFKKSLYQNNQVVNVYRQTARHTPPASSSSSPKPVLASAHSLPTSPMSPPVVPPSHSGNPVRPSGFDLLADLGGDPFAQQQQQQQTGRVWYSYTKIEAIMLCLQMEWIKLLLYYNSYHYYSLCYIIIIIYYYFIFYMLYYYFICYIIIYYYFIYRQWKHNWIILINE